MARRHTAFLILGVSGLLLLFLYLRDTDKGKSGIAPSPNNLVETVSEDAIAPVAGKRPVQVAEISSHGEVPAAVSRELREPKNKNNLTVLRPDERHMAQASLLSGTSWAIWEGVRALPKGHGVPTAFLVEISGYYLVSDAAAISDERQFSVQQPLVVYNKRKGIAGVLTGTLQLVLTEGAVIEDVVAKYELAILDSLPEMKTYFVTSASQPFDLSSLRDRLGAEPGVERVELEILSRQYVKN